VPDEPFAPPTPIGLTIDLALKAYQYSVDLREQAEARLQAEIEAANRDALQLQTTHAIQDAATQTAADLSAVAAALDLVTQMLRHLSYGGAVTLDTEHTEGEWNVFATMPHLEGLIGIGNDLGTQSLTQIGHAQALFRNLLSGLSYYPFTSAGVAAFNADVAAAKVWGGSDGTALDGAILYRIDDETGENVPFLNPTYFTIPDPNGDERFDPRLLLDVINGVYLG